MRRISNKQCYQWQIAENDIPPKYAM